MTFSTSLLPPLVSLLFTVGSIYCTASSQACDRSSPTHFALPNDIQSWDISQSLINLSSAAMFHTDRVVIRFSKQYCWMRAFKQSRLYTTYFDSTTWNQRSHAGKVAPDRRQPRACWLKHLQWTQHSLEEISEAPQWQMSWSVAAESLQSRKRQPMLTSSQNNSTSAVMPRSGHTSADTRTLVSVFDHVLPPWDENRRSSEIPIVVQHQVPRRGFCTVCG